MRLARALMKRAAAAPAPVSIPVAVLLSTGTLAVVGGVGGTGPLGPVFSGPAVPDIDPPLAESRAGTGPARREARGQAPGVGRRGGAAPAAQAAPAVSSPAARSGRPGDTEAEGAPRPRDAPSTDAPSPDAPSPPPRPNRPGPPPSPTAPPPSPPPESRPGNPIGDPVRDVGEALPEPLRTPTGEIIDRVLGPGG